MLFDATNPYHRAMMHYESDQQLSIPEIIAKGSVDAHTTAILWYMLEHRASIIVAGPTDPTPGVGKTTTLNALLPFYPTGTGFVYTVGMFEDFDFINQTTPQETTVLANEVSNHLRIYMWGKVARQFIKLPEQGYAIATTCHADTLREVLAMLSGDLRLAAPEIQQVQLIVNIGIQRRPWPARRRWLTTHFIAPNAGSSRAQAQVDAQLVSAWDNTADSFIAPDAAVVAAMAAWAGVTATEFTAAVARREACLRELADAQADQDTTILTIEAFREGAGG